MFYPFPTVAILAGECYRLGRAGSRHLDYQLEYRVPSKSECAEACRRTAFCRSFSYQYQFRAGSGSILDSNCLISRNRVQDLNRDDYRSVSRKLCGFVLFVILYLTFTT